MKKNNNKISLHNIKRAKYVDRRKKRINDEVNKKVEWLEHIVYAGENLDMSKIIDSARNIKQAKLIIDRLVSRNVGRTMSQKKEIKIAN
jgi:hypothetical protein